MNNTHPISNNKSVLEIVFLIIFPLSFALLISHVGFLLNFPIQKYYYPIAFVISCVISKTVIKSHNFIFVRNVFITIFIILISFFISGYFYDLSSDGQWYHQEMIICLKEGWNPIFEDPVEAKTAHIWLKHYPKGIETIQSGIYAFTNRIETGKAVNILLILSVFLLSLLCLQKLNLKKYKRYIYSFLIAVNPICVSQVFTYYIDGVLCALIACVILSFILIITNKHIIYYFVFGGSLLIAASIKFTSIPIIGIIAVFLLLFLVVTKKHIELKRVFYTCLFVGVVCFPIVNANPYITNLSEGKHIFYPIQGEGSIDIITPFVPKYFNELNRFEKFSISFFSKSGQVRDGENILKIPFSVYKKELNRLADSDIGLAGFGVFYSGIVILTLIILLMFFIRNKLKFNKHQKFMVFLIALLLVSVFVIPEPFWFRYIPQFYFIPILLLLIIETPNSNKYGKLEESLKGIVFIFYFLNISLFVVSIFSMNIYNTEKINYQLKQIKDRNVTIKIECFNRPSNLMRFKENDIPYRVGHFEEEEKHLVIPPYEESKKGTKIEYFDYNPKIEKSFLHIQLDKFFSRYKSTL